MFGLTFARKTQREGVESLTIVLLQPSTPDNHKLKLKLVTDNAGLATAIEVHYGDEIQAKANFKLTTPFLVPTELLEKENGVTRLISLPQIRKKVIDGSQALEDNWRELVTRVSTASIELNSDGKFAGAIAFPSGANISGIASFNLGASLSSSNSYAKFVGFIALSAKCQVDVQGKKVEVTMEWRIDVAAAMDIPKLSLNIPSFGIAMPPMPFQSFNWSNWKPGNFEPDFRMPALPGLPIKAISSAAALNVTFDPDTSVVTAKLTVSEVKVSAFGSDPVLLGNMEFKLDNGQVTVTPFQGVLTKLTGKLNQSFTLVEGLTLVLHKESILELALDIDNGRAEWVGCLDAQVSLYPSLQPAKLLNMRLRLPFREGRFQSSVAIGGKNYTRQIDLLKPNIINFTAVLIESISSLNGIAFSFRVPGNMLPSTDSLVEVIIAILSASGRGAAGLARVVQSVLEKLFKLLRSAAQSLSNLEVLFVIDVTSGRLLQLVLQLRHSVSTGKFVEEAGGFEIKAPKDADLALLIDLREGSRGAYAVVTPRTPTVGSEMLSIGTDLWFSTERTERPAGDAKYGDVFPDKLIRVKFEAKNADRLSLVPFGIREGQATFLQALDTPLPVLDRSILAFVGYKLMPIDQQVKVTAEFPDKTKLKNRLLPFLTSPSETPSSGSGTSLKQYIEINEINGSKDLPLSEGRFDTAMKVTLHVINTEIKSDLKLSLDARKMTASLKGGLIYIDAENEFSLFGMKVLFRHTETNVEITEKHFQLDLSGSDPRLSLATGVTASLEFTGMDKDKPERALKFDIEHFVVHGGGLDLRAKLAERFTCKLPGLETDFTFDKTVINVTNGRFETFRLQAKGKLPPQLLGNVDVTLELDFGYTGDHKIDILDGRLELVSKGNLIRSDQTHFEFKLESLGLRVFKVDDGLHFCAFITGSAFFKPTVSELANGMLKKLANVELRFTDCPICGPSDIVKRELEKLNLSFIVALDEPMRATLFDMFSFEVRSIGFEPSCNMFNDRPFSMVIGGQIRFALRGDVVRAECDFHKLYIAPGKETILPRIRCEGLALSLRLGSALEIEGKVVAVDGRMPPNVLLSRKPDLSLKSNGFMGQGRVVLPGLPPFAASFGFMEIHKAGWPAPRLAWFVFLEAQRISYYFQLGPVPFYLREAGFGLGCYFTYVGIKQIDEADNLIVIHKELDKIALTAQEPAKIDTWDISDQGDLTFIGRGMFSTSSASTPVETLIWHGEEEAQLPNLLLLNTVIAMRKSTFMMTANGWLGYNYYDWDKGRLTGGNELIGKQTLSGYVVLAGARSEFLARMVSNPGAEIGSRLALPQQFKDGLKDIQYDATLYMRPGLLHFELGWPNRIRWSKNIAGVNVSVAGGAIFRVYEGAMLAGLNLEGQLSFDMSGSLDAGVVGISVSASVHAALVARIIGYLDSRNVSNSLYYSLFSLQVNIRFQVSAWLEIDAWLCKITISASFSFSLQIDVVAELAIQGDSDFGARMRATIAVSVFGRSLGLSVGLAVNPGLVDNAAARVGRFMNLGLIQDTPSSVASIEQQDKENNNADAVGKQRREALEKAATANLSNNRLARVPQDEKVPLGFEDPSNNKIAAPILATDFFVVLSNLKVSPKDLLATEFDPNKWVYMTFLPKESANVNLRSSFYSSPHTPNVHQGAVDHKIVFSSIPEALRSIEYFVFDTTGWRSVTLQLDDEKTSATIPTSVNWKASLGYTQTNKDSADYTPRDQQDQASLEQMFFAAFRTEAESPKLVSKSWPYQEPWQKPEVKKLKNPVTSLDKPMTQQEQFNRQEVGYLGAIAQDPADRRCHEARDFLLHKFTSDLFQLAQDGIVPDKTAHIAHLGLTILVPKEFADALSTIDPQSTPVMEAKVSKRIDHPELEVEYAESDACKVFNPKNLRYEFKRPAFENTGISLEGKTVKLHWKLRWPGESTDDEFSQAETYLRHYSIVRTVQVGITTLVSAPITVTCALHEEYKKNEDETYVRIHHLSSTRFTDDFENLPLTVKDEMFIPGSGAIVRYTVTPVCVSDTLGVPCSDFIAKVEGEYQFPRLSEAVVTLNVDPQESGNGTDKAKEFDLDIHIEADVVTDNTIQKIPQGMKLCWRVIARGESILPAGQYGSDAESRQSLATTIGSGLDSRPGDHHFDVPVEFSTTRPPELIWKFHRSVSTTDKELAKLPTLIQGLEDPQSWTLLAQLVLKMGDDVVNSSRLVSMKHAVKVKGRVKVNENDRTKLPDKWEDRYFVTQVPAIEFVRLPFKSDQNLNILAPVAHEDSMVLPGRAALPEPLLKSVEPLVATHNLHPEFGAVSRLVWNIRPSNINSNNSKRFRLRSGFDVYSLSLDTGLDPDDARSWKTAKRLSEVRLLGDERVKLTPGEVGEPSNWKMRYPSHALRRESRKEPWYSAADSTIDWPDFPIRKYPLPEPSSELIKSLLKYGMPNFIALEMVHPKFNSNECQWDYDVDMGTGWKLEIITSSDPFEPGNPDVSNITRVTSVHLRGDSKNDPKSLRLALCSLTASPKVFSPEINVSLEWDRDKRAGWNLELQPMWEKPHPKDGTPKLVAANQDPERVSMAFERDLHPVIECMLTHMRRQTIKSEETSVADVLFEIDRRPAPIVTATQLDEFIGVTGDAADPYGWAALDRLGLGVTVRLYDSSRNRFLEPVKLLSQVKEALIQTQKAYSTDFEKHFEKYLFVECLLRPGAMTRRVAFESLPNDNGNFEKAELDTLIDEQMLAMVRISMRPRIQPAGHSLMKDADEFLGWRAFWISLRRALNLPLPQQSDIQNGKDVTTLARADFEEYKSIWRQWNRRYFEFSGDPENTESRYAFGAVEQTQPVLTAANAIGQISVTLPETDGWAHRRAFAIIPQWRYANLLRDCGVEMDMFPFSNYESQETIDHSSRELETTVPAPTPLATPSPAPSHVISSIERSAPILPQIAYSLGRIGDAQWWRKKDGVLVSDKQREAAVKDGRKAEEDVDLIRLGSMPGKDIVFAMPLHPEQILDEDNAPLARSLSLAGLMWQMGLHSMDAAWSGEYQAGHQPSDSSGTEIFNEDSLKELLIGYERQGKSVAQSKIRVVRNIPHWYRHTLHASVSAGISVSPLTATYLPLAYASLVTIKDGEVGVEAGHPWNDWLTSKDPKQTKFPLPVRSLEGPARSACYRFDLPALRYRDTTDEATAELWDDAISILPDPQVAYDLEFRSPETALQPLSSVRPIARIFRSADATPGKLAMQVMPIAKDWEVSCKLGDDIKGKRNLAIQISPLSTPVTLSAALQAALGTTTDEFRVAGGWSFDWLDAIVLLLEEPSTRLALATDLWSALAQAEVGLSRAAELSYFPTYEMRQLKLKRPVNDLEKEKLKQVIGDWLTKLASSEGNLDDSLAAALRFELKPIFKLQWPFADEYTLTVPWISTFTKPEELTVTITGFDLAPGYSPRHLVPELMSKDQYEEAKRAAGEGKQRIDALWKAQKERAWDAGELVIRATRGDAIPLELAPIALV